MLPSGEAAILPPVDRTVPEGDPHLRSTNAVTGYYIQATDGDIGLALVVDAELFRLDAVVRWLDAVDGRLPALTVAEPTAQSRSAPERLRRRMGVRR